MGEFKKAVCLDDKLLESTVTNAGDSVPVCVCVCVCNSNARVSSLTFFIFPPCKLVYLLKCEFVISVQFILIQ